LQTVIGYEIELFFLFTKRTKKTLARIPLGCFGRVSLVLWVGTFGVGAHWLRKP
jgi:hypothetical protein